MWLSVCALLVAILTSLSIYPFIYPFFFFYFPPFFCFPSHMLFPIHLFFLMIAFHKLLRVTENSVPSQSQDGMYVLECVRLKR
jgi:hypothetical protein